MPDIDPFKPYKQYVKENSPPGSIGKKVEEMSDKPKDTGKK